MAFINQKSIRIRHARQQDLPALVGLYNYYIKTSASTFDLQTFTVQQRQAWFEHYHLSGPHQLLVALEDKKLIAYASSSQFKAKAAYDTSVEVSVYVAEAAQGNGLASQLYVALFTAIDNTDTHRAYAGITQPNSASNALHRAFGFESIACLSEVGYKFGQYWDVEWFEKKF